MADKTDSTSPSDPNILSMKIWPSHPCQLLPPCRSGGHFAEENTSEQQAANALGKYHITEDGLLRDLGALKRGEIYRKSDFLTRARAWFKAEVDRLSHFEHVILETFGREVVTQIYEDDTSHGAQDGQQGAVILAKAARSKRAKTNAEDADYRDEEQPVKKTRRAALKDAPPTPPTRVQPPRASKRKVLELFSAVPKTKKARTVVSKKAPKARAAVPDIPNEPEEEPATQPEEEPEAPGPAEAPENPAEKAAVPSIKEITPTSIDDEELAEAAEAPEPEITIAKEPTPPPPSDQPSPVDQAIANISSLIAEAQAAAAANQAGQALLELAVTPRESTPDLASPPDYSTPPPHEHPPTFTPPFTLSRSPDPFAIPPENSQVRPPTPPPRPLSPMKFPYPIPYGSSPAFPRTGNGNFRSPSPLNRFSRPPAPEQLPNPFSPPQVQALPCNPFANPSVREEPQGEAQGEPQEKPTNSPARSESPGPKPSRATRPTTEVPLKPFSAPASPNFGRLPSPLELEPRTKGDYQLTYGTWRDYRDSCAARAAENPNAPAVRYWSWPAENPEPGAFADKLNEKITLAGMLLRLRVDVGEARQNGEGEKEKVPCALGKNFKIERRFEPAAVQSPTKNKPPLGAIPEYGIRTIMQRSEEKKRQRRENEGQEEEERRRREEINQAATPQDVDLDIYGDSGDENEKSRAAGKKLQVGESEVEGKGSAAVEVEENGQQQEVEEEFEENFEQQGEKLEEAEEEREARERDETYERELFGYGDADDAVWPPADEKPKDQDGGEKNAEGEKGDHDGANGQGEGAEMDSLIPYSPPLNGQPVKPMELSFPDPAPTQPNPPPSPPLLPIAQDTPPVPPLDLPITDKATPGSVDDDDTSSAPEAPKEISHTLGKWTDGPLGGDPLSEIIKLDGLRFAVDICTNRDGTREDLIIML